MMKSLLVRLGLATEGTTTPLRRQRATAIPSRPVTAPAEQVFSCVQKCRVCSGGTNPHQLVITPAKQVAN